MIGKIRRILLGLKAEKANTLLMVFLFVVQAAVLSMMLMFSGGDRIAETLLKTVKLDLAFRNDFFSAPRYEADVKSDPYMAVYEFVEHDPEGYYTYLNTIKDGMRQLGQSDDVSYCNFNITTSVKTPGFKRVPGMEPADYNSIMLDYVFGIESFQFFEVNDIGFESFSSVELTEDSLFVPSGAQIRLPDGSLRPAELGDSVEITNPSGSRSHIFTIQGIYSNDFRFDYSYGFDDSFINSSGIVVSNRSIEKLLFDAQDMITLRTTRLNHPVYRLSNYSRLYSFESRMDQFASDLQAFARSNGYNAPHLAEQQSGALKALGNVRGAAGLYNGIFAVVELMLIALLSGFLYYLVSKKKREMFIYYSLVEGKAAVGLRNSMFFGMAGAVGALIGCIPGYFLCRMLSNAVARNSLRIQSELLRYSYYGRTMIKTLDQIEISELDAGTVVKYVVFTIMLTLVITAVIVFISTFVLMRGNVRENIGGGD